MAMMKSRKIKWLVWTSAAVAILLVVATAIISVWVPNYLESELIPTMARKYGLAARQVHIKRIGWFGAEVGPIDLEGAGKPVVGMAAVHIDYSPFSLLRGKIKGITLSKGRVVIAVTPEGLSIPGLNLPSKAEPTKAPVSFPDLEGLLPVGIAQIQLKRSEVVVLWKDKPLAISIDMTLAFDALSKGRMTGKADLSFLGSTIALAAHLDQGANSATLTLDNGHFLLAPLTEFADLPVGMAISANATFKGQSRLELVPFQLKGLNVSGQLIETNIALPSVAFENLPLADGHFDPINIELEATGPTAIKWNCSPFLINGPLKTKVLDLSGEWAPHKPGWVLNAEAKLVLPPQTTDTAATLPEALPLTWQFQGRFADSIFNAHTDLNAHKIHIKLPGGEVKMADIKVAGTLALHPSKSKTPSEITTQGIFSKIHSQYGPVQSSIPRLEINTMGRRLYGQPWRHQADLKMTETDISHSAHDIRLSGIRIDMPLHWPPEPGPAAGTLDVHDIQWKHHRLGDLTGRLQQKNREMEIALRHRSKLFAKLNVLINGMLGMDASTLKVNLPTYRFPEAIDLGRFDPKAAGLLAEGQIEAKAELNMKKGVLTGSAAIKADHGTLRDEQREFHLGGIQTQIKIDDLIALESAPKQKLHVDQLSFGKIKANDLEMEFQLEERQTVVIDKARIQWSQGHIRTSPLRITPGQKRFHVTLFCHQLNLAMVLGQLGAGQASGDGTVDGSIPLSWQKGRLVFDKGLLYSTPGKPGILKLTGTEMVLAGLPPGTPQHTQMDIATEALKDYTYKWAKLSVDSQGENLQLKLQLDGKPNRLLPFAFDKQLGRLKRVSGEGQADFKGISIDLNFKSPLDKILHYKKLLTPNQ